MPLSIINGPPKAAAQFDVSLISMARRLIKLLLLAPLVAAAIEDGDSCSPNDKLSRHFSCFQGTVTDCRIPQGRIGSIACQSLEYDRLLSEMRMRYRNLLRSYDGVPEEGQNFVAAKSALARSQTAWQKYVDADCDLQDATFGLGTAAASAALNCHKVHVSTRILHLKSLSSNLK
jgi:uncharacterized protein YecT (DUF1311 family)